MKQLEECKFTVVRLKEVYEIKIRKLLTELRYNVEKDIHSSKRKNATLFYERDLKSKREE